MIVIENLFKMLIVKISFIVKTLCRGYTLECV